MYQNNYIPGNVVDIKLIFMCNAWKIFDAFRYKKYRFFSTWYQQEYFWLDMLSLVMFYGEENNGFN